MNPDELKQMALAQSYLSNRTVAPVVVEKVQNKVTTLDLWSRMIRDRRIFIRGVIDDAMAEIVVGQMLYLESTEPTKPIEFWINSPGGSVQAGLMMIDVMDVIECPITTIALGEACSMAAVMLACGDKGARKALKSSTIMIHEASFWNFGKSADFRARADHEFQLEDTLFKVMSERTGIEINELRELCRTDTYMTSERAKELNFVDIITQPKAAG